jgi:egghead protein (zeste-white 4 protein)
VTTLPTTRPGDGAELDRFAPVATPIDGAAHEVAAPGRLALADPQLDELVELQDVDADPLIGESRHRVAIDPRDLPWGPWRVRLTFLVAMLVLLVPIFIVLSSFWRNSQPVHGPAGETVAVLSYVWILLAIPVFLNVAGALTYRNASPPQTSADPVDHRVCFRVVTRGTNVDAVLKTVESVRVEMARTPLFPYCVEVVTDRDLPVEDGPSVLTLLVPDSFQTAHGARFKARALQYALETSPIADDTWLFHLDEETHISPSVILGIRNAIADEERSGALRIGQGAVLYHRDLAEHPFLTLADSVRTGDDLGRFRLQHLLGQSAFGMHGSFILVRNDVEKEVGFDLGPAGSVTEDAWWALVEMARGHRSRWVDGYCIEQSTRSVSDFMKQRRRWFVGLCLVCRRAPARSWHRIALVSSVLMWGVSWLGWWSISIAAMIVNVRIPTVVFLVGILSLSAYSALYLLGLELNLDRRDLPRRRRVPWYVFQIVLLPFFSLMESAAVALGILRPNRNVHVVKK